MISSKPSRRRRFVYVDIETTGLEPFKHDVVEVAWAEEDEGIHRFVPTHQIVTADPTALEINGYHARGLASEEMVDWNGPTAMTLRDALRGSTMLGSSPDFDARFLELKWRARPWFHRLIDVPLYAAGLFGWEESRGLPDTVKYMNEILGYAIPLPDHTAAGDVDCVRELHRELRKIAEIRDFIMTDRNGATAKDIIKRRKVEAQLSVLSEQMAAMKSAMGGVATAGERAAEKARLFGERYSGAYLDEAAKAESSSDKDQDLVNAILHTPAKPYASGGVVHARTGRFPPNTWGGRLNPR